MGVSVGWSVGRSKDSFSPDLRQRDDTLGGFNAVLALREWLRSRQETTPSPILASGIVARLDAPTIAARSMMEFAETMPTCDAVGRRHGEARAELRHGIEEALSRTETGN